MNGQSDPNIGRILECKYGRYKVMVRKSDPARTYRVMLVSGPDDGQWFLRDAGWVTRERKQADGELPRRAK